MEKNNENCTNTKTYEFCIEMWIEGVGKNVKEFCEWCKKDHKFQDLKGETN